MTAARRQLRGVWVLVAAALFTATTPTAQAQPPISAPGDIRLDVLELDVTGVVTDELVVRVAVRNRGREREEDLRVEFALHAQSDSRATLRGALDGEEPEGLRRRTTVGIGAVAPGGTGVAELRRTPAALGLRRSGDSGVYPLTVRVLRDDVEAARLVTAVVVVPAEVAEPLRLAVLWPVDAPPSLRAAGGGAVAYADAGLVEQVRGGRASALISAAADAAPAVPLALAVPGLLLDQLADLADGYTAVDGDATRDVNADEAPARAAREALAALRRVAALPRTEVIAASYGPSDLAGLVAAGAVPEAVRQSVEGARAVGQRLDVTPVQGWLWPAGPIDDDAAGAAAAAGTTTFVLGAGQVTTPERAAADADAEEADAVGEAANRAQTPSPVRRLRGGGLAVVPDADLTAALGDVQSGDPLLATQRVVAETAATWFEAPLQERPRGLLLAPPRLWSPSRTAVTALLRELADARWLQIVAPTALVDQVPAAPGASALRPDAPPALLEADLDGLREARRGLGSLAAALAGTDAGELAPRLDRLLLAAPSVHFTGEAAAVGRSLSGAVAQTVAGAYAGVRIVQGVPVTLTGLRGQVPVTVRSDGPLPLRIVVRLVSSRYRVIDGPNQPLLLRPGEQRTIAFRAEALTAGGTTPVLIVVQDPDGAVRLTTGQVVVRSTATSATAIVTTAGAALFLAVWWVRDARRRRRARRDADTTGHGPAAPASTHAAGG